VKERALLSEGVGWGLLQGFSKLGHLATSGNPTHAFKESPPVTREGEVKRGGALQEKEWRAAFDERGVIRDPLHLKKLIFTGGVSEGLRSEVWKYLLGIFPWDSTHDQRQHILHQKRELYEQWKKSWQFLHAQALADPNTHFTKLLINAHAIEKDVPRTDRSQEFFRGGENPHLTALSNVLCTYSLYNLDLGYGQGMNEYLGVILYVMAGEEHTSFWGLVGAASLLHFNQLFHKSQGEMEARLAKVRDIVYTLDRPLYDHLEKRECLNMYFCFRWLLILFKREFSFEGIQRVWEVVWSGYLPAFELFLAAAILITHRNPILQQDMHFDDIVQYVNGLALRVGVEEVLAQGEAVFHRFARVAPTPTLHAFFHSPTTPPPT
jgi:hypothetical protein